MTTSDAFRLPENHEALREAVRSLAEATIAPYAAEVDECGAFPQSAYDALRAGDFHARTCRSATAARGPTRSPPAS